MVHMSVVYHMYFNYLIEPTNLIAHHLNSNTCVLILLREETARISTERLLQPIGA